MTERALAAETIWLQGLKARAFASALAVDGEAGVGHALSLLSDEIALGLGLLGCTSPGQVTRAHVQPAGA